MLRLCAVCAAWLLGAYVVFITLAPIGFRPTFGHANLERFAAFLIVGGLFALAYPRRMGWILAAVVIAAFALEAGQLVTPGRHARWRDAAVKAAGGLTGVAGAAALHAARRVRRAPV